VDWLVDYVDQKITDLNLKKLLVFMLLANTVVFVVFIILIIPSQTIWKEALPWIVFMSIFAIIWTGFTGIVGTLAALFACRADEAIEIPGSGVEDPDAIVTTSDA
jgi:glucan phosphoethanolaminetransferase (alkaline phosphatase superfamily)